MDINGPAPPIETTPLARYATNNNLPLIMGSDTNSHHTLWGNRACNERGRDLLDFMSSLGLSWANKGSTPTFLNTRGHNSVIDLTITNTTGGDLISNWHVSDLYSNSDHRYIMFDITTGRKKEPRQIRLVKNTDWAKFDEILKNDPNLQNRNRPEIRLNPVPAGFPASNSGSGPGPVSNRFAGFQPEFDKIF